MVERTWSDTGYLASMDEYLDVGKISIGAHTIILPACCFLSPDFPLEKIKPANYGKITKLFMSTARLLNDTQSYQVISHETFLYYFPFFSFLGVLDL